MVLSGAGAAWADDSFGTIQLGGGGGEGSGVEVALVKPCSRCTVPLVDQRTGVVMGKEPIKTMQGFRCVCVFVCVHVFLCACKYAAFWQPLAQHTALHSPARTKAATHKHAAPANAPTRSGRALGWGGRFGQGATFFGTNGQPLGTGTVRVGDAVRVVKQTDWAAAA